MSDLIAGRYKLDSQIKPGGTVYKAVDQQLRRTVAIKVWPEGRDDIQAARRFYREAVRCARLAHPSIVPVYDAGEHVEISNRTAVPVAPYMVMELVGGRTLASALEGRQPLALSDDRDWVRGALDLFIQVCRGLHYGHERGLVHGAVTPENIIIRSDGEGIKILNYGITPLTEVEPIPYMSPEQLEPGRDLDRRSDLFSLGVVMSEVLLGIHPFCDENPEDTRARIRAGHRSPVEELVPQWASEMGDVIIRLLALNPEERFASCEQLEATLEGLKHQLFNGIRL
ncbi:MAG TPA: serine/threonine-protein kinase, partial [Acidobacteriota bacterium]|nr:serine/threonine-protein kinase [Acidobacteriota bacterium]